MERIITESPLKGSPRILYGVNAVGGGHTNRARILGPALKKAGAQIDFLFSGRDRRDMFAMEPFGDFQNRHGLRFEFNNNGGVHWLKTIFRARAIRLVRDIVDLDMSAYDLVITDFEPIVSRAASLRGIPRIGVAHQYAFLHDVPKAREHGYFADLGIQSMAPVDTALGVHWHHFNQPILPPVFDPPPGNEIKDPKKILVYLNFERPQNIISLLKPFSDWDFYVYHPSVETESDQGHIKLRPPSRKFKTDMADCVGLIGNAGFMSKTESLHLGLKTLVKPQDGQPEQASNALALQRLGIGDVMHELDPCILARWLAQSEGVKVTYPDTATAIAEWVMQGDWTDPSRLIDGLWEKTKFSKPIDWSP